jgi:PAS domain S-box-containing protein
MNSRLQAVPITAVAQLAPDPRIQHFFTPLHNQDGRLINLQAYPATNSNAGAGYPTVHLTDWLVDASDTALSFLWSTLEKGIGCSVTFPMTADRSVLLLITPLPGGYLVERREETAPRPAPDGLQSLIPPLKTTDIFPKDSYELLHAIVANTSVGLVMFRPYWQEGQIVDFTYALTNPANATISGHPMAELIAQTLKTLFPETVSSGLFDRLVDVTHTGVAQHYQEYVQHDGISLWGQFSLAKVGENILFTVTDISPLKEVQALLHEKNGKLEKSVFDHTQQIRDLSALQKAIFQQAGQAIFYASRDGAIQTVNQASEKLLGYTEEEITGLFVRMLPGPGENALPVISFYPMLPSHLDEPNARFEIEDMGYLEVECLITAKDGHFIPTLLAINVLLDEQGTTLGFVGIASDISALKEVESQLLQKNRELTTFFEGALDMHCISDSQGAISNANSAFQHALGYSADELKAIPFLYLIHADEQYAVYEELLKNILQQPVRNQLNRMRRKDGTYRMIEWNAVAIDQIVYGSARDITERQVAERQLRSLNQRLQLATQAAGQGIWEYNLKSNKFIWDDYIWKLHGVAPEGPECALCDFLKFVHPDDRDSFLTTMQAQLQGNKTHIANTYRALHPDGAVRCIETNGRIIRNQHGIPLRLIGVSWDVTERKQAEHALQTSEQRYRSLVNHLNEVVFQVDSGGSWVYLNPAWQTVTGFTVEESLGGFFLNSIFAEDWDTTRDLFDVIKAGRNTYVRHVIRYIHKEGGYRWIDVHAQAMLNEHQIITGISGTLTDITERKKSEEAIIESEQRFREIAENVDEIFWVHSARPFRLLYVNPAYERIWKGCRARLYDQPSSFLESIMDEDRRSVLVFLSRYRAGHEGQMDCRLKSPEGAQRWLSIRTFIIRDEAGQVLRHIGIANDITGLKEKELVLQQALQREQHLNQLKSQFVSTASHEFRTPLTTIQSSVDLIKQYLNVPPDTARVAIQRHLGVIEKEIDQFKGLLTDILTIGSTESGKVRFNPGWSDIVAISNDVITTHFSRRGDLRRVCCLLEGEPRPVFIDPKLIGHVLVNLLSNAFKFSNNEPPVLKIVFGSKWVELVVTDTGIGIPEGELSTLFQAFFRAPALDWSLPVSSLNCMKGALGLKARSKRALHLLPAYPLSRMARLCRGWWRSSRPSLRLYEW